MEEPSRPRLSQLMLPASSDAWEDLGFAIRDDCFTVGAIACTTGSAECCWGFDGCSPAAPPIAGISTASQRVPSDERAAPTNHPNQAYKVDHVVVTTDDVARTRSELERFGLEARGERSVGKGVDRRSQLFFWTGDSLIELVGPTTVRIDSEYEARIWGVTFVVPDFRSVDSVAGELLGEVSAAVQPGREIVTVRREAALGLAVAFMTPHVKQSSSE